MNAFSKLVGILFVIIGGMYSNNDSAICDCLTNPLNENRFKDYDVIVAGQIISDTLVFSSLQQKQFPSHREYLFSVSSVYKADTTLQEYIIKTGIGGGDCGYIFKENRKYLVYAHWLKSDKLTTSICDPTKLLSQAEKDLELLKHAKN